MSISFKKQAELLCEGLNELGVKCKIVNFYEDLLKDHDEVTLFFAPFRTHEFESSTISRISKLMIMFQVSDTTRISPLIIDKINHMPFDLLITPSKWSAKGFEGLQIPIEVLPHAYDPEILKINPNIIPGRILVYAEGFYIRRGIDILAKLLKKYSHNVIVRNDVYNPLLEYIQVPGYRDSNVHYTLMFSSEYMPYPCRGGAFEIAILEMLVKGRKVAIPKGTACEEIVLDDSDVYWFKTDGYYDITEYRSIQDIYHVGDYMNVVVTQEDIDKFLNSDFKYDNKKYIDTYSYINIAKKFISIMDKYL